jgi:hypothetical protein
MLNEVIGEEQFEFLQNRQIHDVVAITQEVLHSVKKQNSKRDIGMNLNTINWIMGCLQKYFLRSLINGGPFSVFQSFERTLPRLPTLSFFVIDYN